MNTMDLISLIVWLCSHWCYNLLFSRAEGFVCGLQSVPLFRSSGSRIRGGRWMCVFPWTQWDKLIDGKYSWQRLNPMNDSEGSWILIPLCKWPKHSYYQAQYNTFSFKLIRFLSAHFCVQTARQKVNEHQHLLRFLTYFGKTQQG